MTKRKKGRSAQFVRLFHRLLDDPQYIALSHPAKTLLVDVAMQYTGKNNGDLAITLSMMKKRGWSSNSTLNRALKKLIKAEWLILTRQGGRHKCSLYALTWESIDECGGKLEVKPTTTPLRPLSFRTEKIKSLVLKKA